MESRLIRVFPPRAKATPDDQEITDAIQIGVERIVKAEHAIDFVTQDDYDSGLVSCHDIEIAKMELADAVLTASKFCGLNPPDDLSPVIIQCGSWAVTEYGVECLTHRYPIPAARLWEGEGKGFHGGWLKHLSEKNWVVPADVNAALQRGRIEHINELREAQFQQAWSWIKSVVDDRYICAQSPITLFGRIVANRAEIYCPLCRANHSHSPEGGHRHCHCRDGNTAFRETGGYVIEILEDESRKALRSQNIHQYREWIKSLARTLLIQRGHRLERRSPMLAVVKVHKGARLSTNAKTDQEFMALLGPALEKELVDAANLGDALTRFLPQVVEICCKLRGYKADVEEHRVIVAGEWLPDDVVEALSAYADV